MSPSIIRKIFFALIVAVATTTHAASDEDDQVFVNKPYSIDLKLIAALDPKPLKVSTFTPDSDPKVQGVRIVSEGRIFPFVYEVVTFPAPPDVDAMLIAISKSLDGHENIILKQLVDSKSQGHLLRYFERTMVNGKPHHVSSNSIYQSIKQ